MIKNSLIPIFLFYFFFSCSSSKDYFSYHPIAIEADSLFLAEKYDLAFKKLDSLFVIYYPNLFKEDICLYIKSAHLSKNEINQKKFFTILLRNYNYNQSKMLWDTLLLELYNKTDFKRRELNRHKKFHEKNSFKGLRERLIEMTRRDQLFRSKQYQDYIYKYKRDSIDFINEKELIYIFENIGYPNEKTHDYDNKLTNISGILLHTSDSIRLNYFVPKLKRFIKNGECHPHILAKIIDQYFLYNGENQIYNTYLNDPIQYDTATTRNLRKQIGLHPSLSINHWIFYKSASDYVKENPDLKKIIERNIFQK